MRRRYPLSPEQKAERIRRIDAAKALGWKGPWRFGNEHLHGTPPNGKRTDAEGDHVPEEETPQARRLCLYHEGIRQRAHEFDEMRDAIVAFANGQEWADKSWKEQPHIKRLFDIAKAIPTSESPHGSSIQNPAP
jgi:hypothetical protein